MSQKYWKSLEEKTLGTANIDSVKDEIDHKTSVQSLIQNELAGKTSSRRNFLKWCGFTFTSAAIATSCENPVKKAIPYLNKPEEITPGKANFYASSFFDGTEYSSMLVKTREGRPIKIEPNELSSVTKAGSSARTQALVLGLYDSEGRYHYPLKNKQKINWQEADQDIKKRLQATADEGKKIALVTTEIISPSVRELINQLKSAYPTLQWSVYDPTAPTAMLEANHKSFGKRAIPQLRFDKADVIVGINADFLGTWMMPVDYTEQYVKNRKLHEGDRKMSRHIQFESVMSLTGTNADERHAINPGDEGAFLGALHDEIASLTGHQTFGGQQSALPARKTAQELVNSSTRAMVVCGTNIVAHQLIVNAINQMLQAYGNTILMDQPLMTKQAEHATLKPIIDDLNQGITGAVIFHDINPLYDDAASPELSEALGKADLTITLSGTKSETTAQTEYVLPLHHPLESWGDFEPVSGKYSLAQPAIRNIYNTRQFEDILLKWTGEEMDFHTWMQRFWKKEFYPQQNKYNDFHTFWVHTLQNGVFEPAHKPEDSAAYDSKGLSNAFASLKKSPKSGTSLLFYEKVGIGNGKYANNPWLQELPDPVTKATWDNYFCVAPAFAKLHNLHNEQVITLRGISLPVLIQPGQADNTIAVAIGYGRKQTGKVADNVGKNVYPLMKANGGHRSFVLDNVSFEVTGKQHPIATTQTHHSMEGREIVREASLETFVNNPKSIKQKKHDTTLYKEHEFKGHHWALVVDLNSCTGCGACAVACQAENNVPVVGKDEVIKKRIMHWIRIDRYYKEDEANPQVVHQPVMCQHCDNAPCENVCPVAATTHSNEGLNQMAYNRCIGTKYCVNNCPYKVRRFNWYKYADNENFDYNMNDDLGRMVLNPDVTVRSRGVVEKCSFCVQRIQENKEQAKLENRDLADGDITPACAQACPANALIFGDLNDPNGRVSKLVGTNRNYHLLEELHTKPSVSYLTKIRNMGAKIEA